MDKAVLDKPIADFEVPATSNKKIKFSDLEGQNIVLYFYPKDSTPGCTCEGEDFQSQLNLFEKLNTVVLGVSKDHLKSHEKFKEKYQFHFELISDADKTLCDYFDVIKEKTLYGKFFKGIERSTF
jgi:peroxiredoxin Q/BCP